MQIGAKIKQLRKKYGLTQQELADRAELSKGFISQLERDLTSPSINTLVDILECLGTSLPEFFSESTEEKVVYGPQDIFETENAELGSKIEWLVTTAQKNMMEPILLTLQGKGSTAEEDAHEGEEFGYVLAGSIVLKIGGKKHKLKKGDSFYFSPNAPHSIVNNTKKEAKVLWVSSPPSF
ncbi:cupin domain-containing protein [Eubacteriales bacterium OttesenSCG-928-N14]|nr:cupin domain-containing protein [Eubacteriales bacterium OttesenSCG-928-N14]